LNPTVGTGISQTIYYAKNIKAATGNTVTLAFTTPARSPDVRILEYGGVDLMAPLDGASGNVGTGTTLDSGALATCTSGDLVVGGATVDGIVVASGPVFTTVAVTPNGLSVEHLAGAPIGTLDVTATQDMNGNWVMQAVVFKQSPAPPGVGVIISRQMALR